MLTVKVCQRSLHAVLKKLSIIVTYEIFGDNADSLYVRYWKKTAIGWRYEMAVPADIDTDKVDKLKTFQKAGETARGLICTTIQR